MNKFNIRVAGLLMLFGLSSLAGLHGPRPLSAQQTGGLPALEKRVETLEALVRSLQKTNSGQADQIATLGSRLDKAEAKLASLAGRTSAVEAKTAPLSVAGTDFVITGMNVS